MKVLDVDTMRVAHTNLLTDIAMFSVYSMLREGVNLDLCGTANFA